MAKAKSGDGKRQNKSAAIREVIAQHPHATSKEVVAILGERGLKVAPTLVYYIKSKRNQAARKEKRMLAADKSGWTGTGNPVDMIVKVKALAAEVGGIANLKRLVDALAD